MFSGAFACRDASLVKGETVTATFVARITTDAGPGERVSNTASHDDARMFFRGRLPLASCLLVMATGPVSQP